MFLLAAVIDAAAWHSATVMTTASVLRRSRLDELDNHDLCGAFAVDCHQCMAEEAISILFIRSRLQSFGRDWNLHKTASAVVLHCGTLCSTIVTYI